jgi:murein DD-endopeptidase MepM/ murein hydrolase activator NlpD
MKVIVTESQYHRVILEDDSDSQVDNKLLSQLTRKGRGPRSHIAQVEAVDDNGDLKSPGMNIWQNRNAYDLMTKPGTVVRSPFNGIVDKHSVSNSKNPYVYGVGVTIKNKDNSDYIYLTHMDPNKSYLTKGTPVIKGDIIGYIGDPQANGKSFAAHLHVATKKNDLYNYIEDDLTII